MAESKNGGDRRYWLDQKRNIDRLYYALAAICAGLLLTDFLIHRHTVYGFDGWFSFFPIWGFSCYAFIVFAGTLLRRLIKRDESYYD